MGPVDGGPDIAFARQRKHVSAQPLAALVRELFGVNFFVQDFAHGENLYLRALLGTKAVDLEKRVPAARLPTERREAARNSETGLNVFRRSNELAGEGWFG
jgi:hypothetical protein